MMILGAGLRTAGRLDEAIETARRAVQQDPEPFVARWERLDDSKRLRPFQCARTWTRLLTGVMFTCKMTPMVKTQVYLGPEELDALHRVAARSDRSVADLIREAIRRVWLRPAREGPVGLWNGEPKRTSVDHDSIYDNP